MSQSFYTGGLSSDKIDAYTKQEADEKFLTQHQDISGKQDVLTAGDNIVIDDNTISASVPKQTPRFSINNANKNAKGEMDVLAYSGQTSMQTSQY